MTIALAQINPTVGDLKTNTDKIITMIHAARAQKVRLVLFSELCITGYPPEDLLLLDDFIETVYHYLEVIIPETEGIIAVVGMPRKTKKGLYNSAAIVADKKLAGYQDKTLLPTYDIFDERRYFQSADEVKIWEIQGLKFVVTICEDIWKHGGEVPPEVYHHDPIEQLKGSKIDFLLNLSASPFSPKQMNRRIHVCAAVAKTLKTTVYLCNQVGGNDSIVFDGNSLEVDKDGKVVGCASGFEEQLFLGGKYCAAEPVEQLFKALSLGVKDYFSKQGFTKACLGISGGVDSAVVAAVAVDALGAENVLGLAMPSRYSSEASFADARQLAQNLGIRLEEVSIEEPHQAFLDLLSPHFAGNQVDTTEENIQARIRSIILMAFSNKFGYILLSTGNKSELAMGYSTLYGDLSGGLSVISDVTKKDVYALARWINRNEEVIPRNILVKAPSAELRPNQKDSDTLPDYAIIDAVLTGYVEEHKTPQVIAKEEGIDPELVLQLVSRIHRNEYKRRQSPPGLRVSAKAFTVGRKFPIVQRWVY